MLSPDRKPQGQDVGVRAGAVLVLKCRGGMALQAAGAWESQADESVMPVPGKAAIAWKGTVYTQECAPVL